MKKSIIIIVSFFVIFLMVSNTTAVSNTLNTNRKKIFEKKCEENKEIKNYEDLEKEINILKNNLDSEINSNIFIFLYAWLFTWAIHLVDFFEKFHPIAYKIMVMFDAPLLVPLFFPMTYVLLVISFFEVLFS